MVKYLDMSVGNIFPSTLLYTPPPPPPKCLPPKPFHLVYIYGYLFFQMLEYYINVFSSFKQMNIKHESSHPSALILNLRKEYMNC